MKILITAGPTREPIDAVRFISNRSSAKTGIAIAQAAAQARHQTTLLLGPGPLTPPTTQSLRTTRFETTDQLAQLLHQHWPDHDVLIMAAAVADFRPNTVHEGKLPRQPDAVITLHLEPTPDLVAQMANNKRANQRVIAFALQQPQNLTEQALQKMHRKGVDAIIANPLETMQADTISPIWLTPDGQHDAPGLITKTQFATWLIEKLEQP